MFGEPDSQPSSLAAELAAVYWTVKVSVVVWVTFCRTPLTVMMTFPFGVALVTEIVNTDVAGLVPSGVIGLVANEHVALLGSPEHDGTTG